MTWVEKLKPRKVVLTHMNNEMDYEHLTTMLPHNCFPAYDGLTIKI
jgi:phosphoribosyl 1,2-cyclic phosphate phosphodiesterase